MGLRRWLGLAEPEPPPPATPEAPAGGRAQTDPVQAVAALQARVTSGELPAVVASRLERICATLWQTLPRLDTLGTGSAAAHDVVTVTTDYLPSALDNYLRLPRDWADSRPIDGGRTALMVLIDQLDLVSRTLDTVYDAVCRADAETLVLQGRFLHARLDVPPHPTTGGQR